MRKTAYWRRMQRAIVRAPHGRKRQAQRDLRNFVHDALRAHVEGQGK